MRQRDNSGDELVLVSCTIERETQKAFLIETEDRTEHWVPKSQSQKVAGGLKIKKWLIDRNDILVGHHQMMEDARPADLGQDPIDDADDYDRIPDSAYQQDYDRGEDDIPF